MKIKKKIAIPVILLLLLTALTVAYIETDKIYGFLLGGNIGGDGYNITNITYMQSEIINSSGMVYYMVQNEISLNPTALQLPGTNPPDKVIVGNFPTLAFSSSTTESAYSQIHVPAQYKTDSDWQVEFYWTANTVSKNFVTWCVDFTKARSEDSGYINGTSITKCVNDTFLGNPYLLQETTKINISGANTINDDNFGFRIYRDQANDNMTVDANLIEVSVYYVEDKIGYEI